MGWFGLQAASSKCTAEMILSKQSVRTYCFLKHSFKMTVIHYVPTQSTLNYCSVTHEWEYFITQPSLKKKWEEGESYWSANITTYANFATSLNYRINACFRELKWQL